MTGDETGLLQQLRDERDVREVLTRYGAAMDARDWDMLRSCFTPDATIASARAVGRRDDWIDSIEAQLAHYGATMHMIGSSRVDIAGDRCHGTTSCLAYHCAGPGSTTDLVVGAVYEDDLTRQSDGAWRIAERSVHIQWTRTLAGT